jgi:hypothetical protein
MPRPFNVRAAALANGWRSGLEEALGAQLSALGVDFTFEDFSVPFTQPLKPRKYTPDFALPNGIVIESKGRFLTADRQKHILVKDQHPDLELRFVFSNPNTRISKQSKTTYAIWCESKGFKYAKGLIPESW